jgi:hypothetical protein
VRAPLGNGLDVGIAADLRSARCADGADPAGIGGPDDRLEEYDSQATVDAIGAALRARGHRPRFLGGGREFVEAVLARPPELVFNLAEGAGTRSREAHVPAVCEMLGIPFTGSDPLTLAATLDKAVAKRLVASAGSRRRGSRSSSRSRTSGLSMCPSRSSRSRCGRARASASADPRAPTTRARCGPK